MKLFIIFIFLFSSMSFAKDFKVGIVEFAKVLEKSSKGKKTKKVLDKMSKKFQKQIKKREKAFKKMQKDFGKKQSALSDEAKRKYQEKMQIASLRLQKAISQASLNLQKEERKRMLPIMKQLEKAVNRVAKKGNYDLILRKQVVLYNQSSSNVTDEVIKQFNKLGR